MIIEQKQNELFKYINNNLNRILRKDLKLVEGLDNTEFIDFEDSQYTYTIAKQDITEDLISQHDSEDSLQEFVFKKLIEKSEKEKSLLQ